MNLRPRCSTTIERIIKGTLFKIPFHVETSIIYSNNPSTDKYLSPVS